MEEEIFNSIKKSSKRIVTKCLLAVFGFIAIFTVITVMFSDKSISNQVDATGLKTTLKEAPINSSPENESDIDNLAYLAYNISINKSFKSESTGTATSKVLGIPYVQQIHDSRIVKDEYMLQQTISCSSMVSFGLQKFYFDDKIIRRDGKASDTNNVAWSDEASDAITYKLAEEIYGWTPDQISPYIICKESILSTERLSNGENGYYEIKVSFDPSKAPYYYQRQVKEFAGANEYPNFTEIYLTFKFDSAWSLLSIHTEEAYQISMMGMNLTIKTNIDEVFSYDDDIQIEEKDFFMAYKNLTPKGEADNKITPQSLLLEAFSPILNGNDSTYLITLNINEQTLKILLKLSLSSNIYIFNIDDKIYGEFDKNSNTIYLTYDTLKLKYDLNNVNDTISCVKNIMSELGIESSNISIDSIDTNKIVDELLGSEVVLDSEQNASITSKLNILGIDIDVIFKFDYTNDGYKLNCLDASTSYENYNLTLNATESDKDVSYDINSTHQELSDINNVLNKVYDLIENDYIYSDVSINYGAFNVTGNIKYIVSANILEADLTINYLTLKFDVIVYYSNNTIILKYNDAVVNATTEEIKSLLESFNINFDQNVDLTSVLSIITNVDIDSTIKSLFINENTIDITLFLKDSKTYNLNVTALENGLTIKVNDLINCTISKSDPFEINVPESKNISNLFEIVKYISKTDSEAYNIDLSLSTTISNYNIKLSGNLYIDKTGVLSLDGVITIDDREINAKIVYKNKLIYLTVFDKTFEIDPSILLGIDVSSNNSNLSNIISNLSYEINSTDDYVELLANLTILNFDISDISAKISATSYKEVEIDNIDYTISDFNNLFEFIKSNFTLLSNGELNINGKFDLDINDTNLNVNIDVNADIKNMIFSASVSLTHKEETIEILVSYKNDQLLLSYENISVSLTKEEITNLINYINEKFDLGISLDQSIQIDLLSLLNTLTFNIEANKIYLSVDLSSISESIGTLSLILTNTENGIVISVNDQIFDNVSISNIELTISDNYKEKIVNKE